jgi:predicted DNA-binding mobile mystery protein A
MADARAAKQARRSLDQRLVSLPDGLPATPQSGWIRAVRTALGMTQREFAHRMGITAQSAFQLEASEREQRIRLDTLRRAADALNCDLAYALVPRAGSLEQTVRQQATAVFAKRGLAVERTMALEDQLAPLDAITRDELIDQLISDYPIWQAL